jgi:hypothetical protein
LQNRIEALTDVKRAVTLHYYSAHSQLGLFMISDQLHQVLRSCYLLSLDYLSLQQLRYHFPYCVYHNPLRQLALQWEETRASGENPRHSVER